MIELQQKTYAEYDGELKKAEFEEVLIGAQILKAATDFDRFLYQGMSPAAARLQIRKQKSRYNPAILAAFDHLTIQEREQVLRLPVAQITEGMIAAEDIVARNGVLIIPKVQTITRTLQQGLKNFSTQVGVVEPIRVQIVTPADDR